MKIWSDYWIWFYIFLFIVFVLWLFYGGANHEFVGLEPWTRELERQKKRTKLPLGKSKGETLCCMYMEEITGKEFKKERPNFLRNPYTGCNLELDGYNEELKLAVEYNGLQHYLWPNSFHKTEQEFRDLVWRDQFKRDRCDEEGIYLITVPYHIPFSKIKQYLIDSLPSTLVIEDEDDLYN